MRFIVSKDKNFVGKLHDYIICRQLVDAAWEHKSLSYLTVRYASACRCARQVRQTEVRRTGLTLSSNG
jgi:hypothetical protein